MNVYNNKYELFSSIKEVDKIHIHKYQIFSTVVRLGSLTKTAQALNLTQSAVSHAIAGLENELGLKLLIRNRSGIRLTDSGERILKKINELLQINDQLLVEVDAIKGLETGKVTLGTFSSVSIQWLPQIMQQFQEQYPHIDIQLLDGNYTEIENWIIEGHADLGFVHLPVSSTLQSIHLYQDQMVCVLPAHHPLQQYDYIKLEQIMDEPFVMPVAGCDTDVQMIWNLAHMTPKIKYRLEDDHAIIAMVKHGLGISILPEMILRSMYTQDLCLRPLAGVHQRTIGIAATSFQTISPATQKFIACIQSFVEQYRIADIPISSQ